LRLLAREVVAVLVVVVVVLVWKFSLVDRSPARGCLDEARDSLLSSSNFAHFDAMEK